MSLIKKIILAFGFLLAAGSAHATNTVLLACGEDSCGTPIGTGTALTTNTGSTTYRTAWARESLQVGYTNTAADPPAQLWAFPAFTASSNIWIHVEYYTNNTGNATSNIQAIRVLSPDNVARIIVRADGSNHLKVSTRNAAATITDLATSTTLVPAGLNTIDVNINYTCSGSGGVSLSLNGVQGINFSGNPCTDSATSLNQVQLAAVSNTTAGSNGVPCTNANTTTGTCWSELIVQNFSTLGEGLLSLTPTGSGNTQGFTPNTLANINKTLNNDATSITANTTGVQSQWTQGASIPAGSWGVIGVAQDFRVQRGSSGPQTFLPDVRTASTDYTGSSQSPITSYTNFNYIWATNPNTSASWALTDITAPLQYGLESNP